MQQCHAASEVHGTLPDIQERQRLNVALRERWDTALTQEGIAPINGTALFAKLLSSYTEVWRHYHTAQHLFSLFNALKEIDTSIYNDSAVIFAAFFHDVVYRPGASDNEEASAVRCREYLSALNISSGCIEKAERLILLTKQHLLHRGTSTEDAFIDADLMILARPWEEYLSYAKSIRKEFCKAPDDIYLARRSAFLEGMIATPTLYRHANNSQQLDWLAKSNMKRELELLSLTPKVLLGSKDERLLLEWPSKVIAITGTIGSGKSTALKLLESKGAYVISADQIVRDLYTPGSPLLEELKSLLGSQALLADGTVNRGYVGKVVFSNPALKAALEQLTHPVVHRIASRQFAEAIKAGKEFLVYELPLLFENGLEILGFKKILLITASEQRCIERIVSRSVGRIDEGEARLRIASQLAVTEKAAKADVVIDNSGSVEQLTDLLSHIR